MDEETAEKLEGWTCPGCGNDKFVICTYCDRLICTICGYTCKV